MTGSRPPHRPDWWARLKEATPARIGLGLSGAGLPTRPWLDFQADHARARDAVHAPFDVAAVQAELDRPSIGLPSMAVRSRAGSRREYLQRPDLGRRLDEASAADLVRGDSDIAFVIADGLSPAAIHAHAAGFLDVMVPALAGWRIAPLVIASGARVALGDEIGERLGAGIVVVLIGERPGLSACDSLGIYVTWNPIVGRQDHERNCISNVREPGGLSYRESAEQLAWILNEARTRRLTGVALKPMLTPALAKIIE